MVFNREQQSTQESTISKEQAAELHEQARGTARVPYENRDKKSPWLRVGAGALALGLLAGGAKVAHDQFVAPTDQDPTSTSSPNNPTTPGTEVTTDTPVEPSPTDPATTPNETETDVVDVTTYSPEELATMTHEELVDVWRINMTLEEFQDSDYVLEVINDRIDSAQNRFGDFDVLANQDYSSYGGVEEWATTMAGDQVQIINEAFGNNSSTGDLERILGLMYKAQLDCYIQDPAVYEPGANAVLYTPVSTIDESTLVIGSTETNSTGDVVSYHDVTVEGTTTSNVRETILPHYMYTEDTIDSMESAENNYRIDSISYNEDDGTVTVVFENF